MVTQFNSNIQILFKQNHFLPPSIETVAINLKTDEIFQEQDTFARPNEFLNIKLWIAFTKFFHNKIFQKRLKEEILFQRL